MMFLRDRRHRRLQHAVDAVLDDDGIVAAFDVNITGPPLERRKNDRVDETNNRAGFFLRDLFDRDRLFTAFVFANKIQLETLGRLFQHALRRLRFLQQVLDFRERSDFDGERTAQQRRHFIDHHEIARIRHGDHERRSFDPQRNDIVAEHQIDLNRPEQLEIEMNPFEIDKLVAVPLCQPLRGSAVFFFVFDDFFHPCTDVPRLNIGI